MQLTLQGGTSPAKPRKPQTPPRPRERKDKAWDKKTEAMSWMIPPPSREETAFRHSHWDVKRRKVRAALESVNTSMFTLDRFDCCGSECTVEHSKTLDKFRLKANYCHNRHCEPCMRAKGNRMAANLKKKLAQDDKSHYRFVTLTLKHSLDPLRDQIRRLYASFKKLRSMKLWKKSQRGGAVILEVKYNPGTKQWHPHLHAITAGTWIKQADLSNAWLQATGDSTIVHIRMLDSGKDAAHYVAKYVTKGTNDAVWNDKNAAQEWITATKGVRTCATFGTWRGYKLLQIQDDADDWKRICSLNALISDVSAGKLWATNLLIQLRPPGSSDSPTSRSG